ncbi:LysR family transcriptional regulator [Phyllobacterium salinisoli]|uniref:LysR family transcriptional regulator n=1 Tax=Phyllobacterium salinisoli TaxID=1899321 RepID=A0A368K061_9HYPH|nr:LysR family transcriptional regulator [Phyllobacterium salinisoli]RCS22554.1 LysR family transcriptional regulator [Phyllobacterium salinisoli]
MDRFEAMRTLVAAIDGGSLSAASRSLGVPLPTVSRRVSDLETYLHAQLVVRTSRKLLLTDAGQAFVATCRRVLDELDEAERAATGEYRVPRGEMFITAPIMFGRMHVEPVVLDFLKAYPDISVRLVLADYVLDIVENQVELAVRIGALPDSSLVATKLGVVRWVTCASPAYLAERGRPESLEALAAHDCIAFERLYATDVWTFRKSAGRKGEGTVAVPIRPRFAVNTADGAIDAALAGAGIARILSYQAAKAIAGGQLIVVLPDFQPEPLPVHLVHTGQAIMPLKLRAFADFATPRLKDRLLSG